MLKWLYTSSLILLLPICAGAELLASHNFDDQSLSPFFGFQVGHTTISSDVSRSGSYSVKMEEGGVDGSLNLTGFSMDTEGDSLYIKYYQYFPSGWSWTSVSETGLKQMKNGVYEGADGWPIYMFKWTDQLRTHCYFSPVQGGRYVPISQPSVNTWHKVEIYVVLSNTVGGFWWKIDDVLIAGSETMNYDSWPALNVSGNPITIQSVRFAGGNGFPAGGYYYVDDVEVWLNEIPDDPGTIQRAVLFRGTIQ